MSGGCFSFCNTGLHVIQKRGACGGGRANSFPVKLIWASFSQTDKNYCNNVSLF